MEQNLKVVVDTREPEVMVALLSRMGVNVERRTITPGDYVISGECAIERKTVNDFMNSLFSGRLFEQASRLKEAYSRSAIMLEGNIGHELEGRKNPRVFWGALLRLEMDMGIPVFYTLDAVQTAEALYTLAKRLQLDRKEGVSVVHKPKILTEKDLQTYVVCGLPGIGEKLANRLLKHFGSIRKIFQASEKDLVKVDGIGLMKSERISRLLDSKYDDAEERPENIGKLL